VENVARRLLITGQVQRVGYRVSCAREADGLGVNGSVRNLDDGSVEVIATGPREAVERLTEWCRRGPRGARVEAVTVTDAPAEYADVPVGGFQIRV
jgi:acylphosphatase